MLSLSRGVTGSLGSTWKDDLNSLRRTLIPGTAASKREKLAGFQDAGSRVAPLGAMNARENSPYGSKVSFQYLRFTVQFAIIINSNINYRNSNESTYIIYSYNASD